MIYRTPPFVVLWDYESKERIMINAGKLYNSRNWVTESTQISPNIIMINSPLSERGRGGRKRNIVRCISKAKAGEKAMGSPESHPRETSPWPPTTKKTKTIMIRLWSISDVWTPHIPWYFRKPCVSGTEAEAQRTREKEGDGGRGRRRRRRGKKGRESGGTARRRQKEKGMEAARERRGREKGKKGKAE